MTHLQKNLKLKDTFLREKKNKKTHLKETN